MGRENSHAYCNELISPPLRMKSISGLLSIEPDGDELGEDTDPAIASAAADSSFSDSESDSVESSCEKE
jgi:hypothetical protein